MLKTVVYHIIYLMVMILFLSGCDTLKQSDQEKYLLKSGNLKVFSHDFERMYENEKSMIEYDDYKDSKLQKYLKLRALKQLKEELVLRNIALEKNIEISDGELQEKIDDVKSDYPDDSFEQMLVDQVISYNNWVTDLKTRMLIDKVVTLELENNIPVDPLELSAFYKKLKSNGIDLSGQDKDNELIKRYRKSIAEKKYSEWIEIYQEKYVVEVNSDIWDVILKED